MDRLLKKSIAYHGIGNKGKAKATMVIIRYGLIMLIAINVSFLPSISLSLTVNSLERTVSAGLQTYVSNLSGEWIQSASDTQYFQVPMGVGGRNRKPDHGHLHGASGRKPAVQCGIYGTDLVSPGIKFG